MNVANQILFSEFTNENFEDQLTQLKEEYATIKDSLYTRFNYNTAHSRWFVVFVCNLISVLNSKQKVQKSSRELMIWFAETMHSLETFNNQTNILLLIIAKFLNIEIDTAEPKLDLISLAAKIPDKLYKFIEKIINETNDTKQQMKRANPKICKTEEKVIKKIESYAGLKLVKNNETGKYHLDGAEYENISLVLRFFNAQVANGEVFDHTGKPVVTKIAYVPTIPSRPVEEDDYNSGNQFQIDL